MNEGVEKTVSDSLNGFQWILVGLLFFLILYLIFRSLQNNK